MVADEVSGNFSMIIKMLNSATQIEKKKRSKVSHLRHSNIVHTFELNLLLA